MKRNSKRSSILKPPKQIVRAPLQELDDLPLDDEEGYTHTSSRRVSFSRTSQIKEFDPTMGCISVWNQNYEESLNAADSEESQVTSPNGQHEILSVHLTKMNSRRKSSLYQVSQKGSSIETVEDECVKFSDARKVKDPRKSILSVGDVTSSGNSDMTKFLMEVNATKSSKCTSMEVSVKTNLSVFEFSETEIINSKVEHSQITNKENLNTFISNSDAPVKMSGNLVELSSKKEPKLKPDADAENYNSDMDMTLGVGGFQQTEADMKCADMEFTVPGGGFLQHDLGVNEKVKHPASCEDESEDHTYVISKENVQNFFQNSDQHRAPNVIKTMNAQSSLPVMCENQTTKDLLPKRIPCNENIMSVGKNPQTNREICPGSEEMELTFLAERVEKLNVDPSYCAGGRVEGPHDVNAETKSLTFILNPNDDHVRAMATQRHCESNMELTVAYGGITNADGDQISNADVNVHSQVMTETYPGEQGMEFTVPLGKINIGKQVRTNEQLETKCRNYISEGTSGLSDALHLRLDKSNKPAKLEFKQADCSSHMDLTTANGGIAVEDSVDDRSRNIDSQSQDIQKFHHDTRGTQPISLNEILGLKANDDKSNTITLKNVTNPGNSVDNENGYSNSIQRLDEICADMEGMELTIPLGKLKVNKAVEHAEKEMDSLSNNGKLINSGEIAAGQQSTTKFGMDDNIVGKAHWRMNSTIIEDFDTLNETCGVENGMEFTTPLGEIKERNQRDKVAVDGGVSEVVSGDINDDINDKLESLDVNCGDEYDMDFTVPLGRIKQNAGSQNSCKNDGDDVKLVNWDVINNEEFETSNENCGAEIGMEFTVPLGRIALKNREEKGDPSSKNYEEPKELPHQEGEIIFNENNGSLDETCGFDNGMEFTVPLGRIKMRNLQVPTSNISDEGADALQDVAVTGSPVILHPKSETSAHAEGQPDVPKSLPNETFTDGAVGSVITPSSGNQMTSGEVHSEGAVESMPVRGDVTIGLEPMDDVWDAESEMEFTVPLGRIKERNLKAIKKCADSVHECEDVAGNPVILQLNNETSANVEGQPEGSKSLPNETSTNGAVGSVITPGLGNQITSGEVHSEGAAESISDHGDVTIEEDHEPMEEMWDAESEMEFTVPLGRIKERLQKNTNVSVHEEGIVEHLKVGASQQSGESVQEFISVDNCAKNVAGSDAVEAEIDNEHVHPEDNFNHGEEYRSPDCQTFKENCAELMDVVLTTPEEKLESQENRTATTSSMTGNSHVNRVEVNDNHLASIGHEDPGMEVVNPTITPTSMGSTDVDLKDTDCKRTANHKEDVEVNSFSLIENDEMKLKLGDYGSATSQIDPHTLVGDQDHGDSSPLPLGDIVSDCNAYRPEPENVETIDPSTIPFSENANVPTTEKSDELMEKFSDDIKVCMQNITVRSQKSFIAIKTDEMNPVHNPASLNQMESKGDGSNAESEICQPCESVENESMMSVSSDDSDFNCDLPVNSPMSATEVIPSMEEESIDVPLSEDTTVCVQHWVQEESKRKSCPWLMYQMSDNQWSFLVFWRAIVLIVNLKPVEGNPDSKDNRIVESVIMRNALTENNDSCIKLASKIILSRFSSSMLTAKCMFSGQLPSLLEFLDAELKPYRCLLQQLYKLDRCSPVNFNNDGFSFQVTSMKLMLLFEVNVCVNNWKNGGVNPEDVTITNYIGKTRISDIQGIVLGVDRDQDFLFNLYDAVIDLILDLEMLL